MTHRIATLITLTTLGLAGCQETIEQGSLAFCSSFEISGPDTITEVNGQVTAIDADTVDCARSITVTDEGGTDHIIGLTVTGPGDADLTPTFDVAIGDDVTLHHHFKQVWGTVEGFVLSDEQGLVMAVDEGAWGGVFDDTELGFSVGYSDEPFMTTTSECLSTDYHDVVFSADSPVVVAAGASDELRIDGETFTGTAVTAKRFGPGKKCEVSDMTNYLTWVVSR